MESPYQKLVEDHVLTLSIIDGPEIKLTPEGFYYNGNLIEEDYEVYQKFKEWINLAHKIDLPPGNFNI